MSLSVLIVLASLTLQGAAPQPAATPADPAGDALAIQVMLDRAGFSPGTIDGRSGANTTKALEAYKQAGRIDGAPVEPLARYRITPEDAAGPFVQVPTDLMQQSKLPSLAYTSVLELLAERFHATPDLLRQLNPQATFVAGEEIAVPNVEPMMMPPPPETPAAATPPAPADPADARPAVTVTVSKRMSTLTVVDAEGQVLFYAPVTTGSENDPLPIGEWKVNGVQLYPVFHYNPDLFWDADPAHAKAKIPAGPNNPVGLVWIDISKEHYGLHGTAEPTRVGHTQSHGCVRLTNWDALRLANLVAPGTRVVFTP